jgi:hypothetical protein
MKMPHSQTQKGVPQKPRDDLRSAYSGDENQGPAGNQKQSTRKDKTKGRRLPDSSGKTPVR